jgi:two-component system chemotaxis sensor kinase CheA
MDELLDIFTEEAQDIFERIKDALNGFCEADDQQERFAEILRGIHTIKGGAATCGLLRLKDLSHKLESNLLQFKGQLEKLKEDDISKITRVIDRFEEIVSGDTDESTSSSSEDEMLQIGQKLASNDAFSAGDKGFVVFDEEEENPEIEGEASVHDISSMPASDVASDSDSNHEKHEKSASSNAKEAEFKLAKKNSAHQDTLRVPLERIQRNFDTISEIFLTRNQLKYLVERMQGGSINSTEFFQNWEVLDNTLRKNIGELEQNAMAMRMLPIKSLLRRMESAVRTYCDETGKNIKVHIEGEETELDKKVLDSLAEPLIHLTRNAMDHGIEDEKRRMELKKPLAAKISFKASVVGNDVILSISDDGRGIDAAGILASAKKKGIDTSHISNNDEAIRLIFQPGFSTKEQVSDVSGRGIGMDAVKTYVEGIGGQITIDTKIDCGSSFHLRLPLGMSVIPAILVRANHKLFAVTASDVRETRKVPIDDIHINGKECFYNRNGVFIPCYNVDDFIYQDFKTEPLSTKVERVSLCLIDSDQGLIALRVQELISNVEIVTKSLPPMAYQLPYVTGISIMATGEPTFVVSLKLLYQRVIKTRELPDKELMYGAA